MASKVIKITDGSFMSSEMTWYAAGIDVTQNISYVFGCQDDSSRRVGRLKFITPSDGASSVDIALVLEHAGYAKIPLRYYIGTDSESHINAGPDAAYTGELVFSEESTSGAYGHVYEVTAQANLAMLPNETYYLWIFPAQDSPGFYYGIVHGRTSSVTLSGSAFSKISGENGTLDAVHTLNLTRYAADLTHTIKAACGTEEMTICTDLQADSAEWTPPIGWATQNTTGTTVPVVITCITYSGTDVIGSSSITLTFTIPPSVVPSVTFTEADRKGYLAVYGKYVQGKSQIEVTVEGSGVYGSEVTSFSVTCGSQTKTGTVVAFDLPQAGTILIQVTVIDSRGRSNTASATIEVMVYSVPTAIITSVYRCDAAGNEDPDGELAKAVFSATVTPMDGKNTASYVLRYRPRGTTSWTSVTLEDLTGQYSVSGGSRIVGVSVEVGYEFSLKVTDNFAPPVESSYRTIQVAFAFVQLNRGIKSLGVGTRATMPNTAMYGLAALLMKGLRLVPVEVESFDEIDDNLTNAVANLDDNGIDFQCYRVDGVIWHCILFKKDSEYATAEFFGYNGRKRKALIGGIWGELTAENEDKFQPLTQEAYDTLVSSGTDDPTAFYMILGG